MNPPPVSPAPEPEPTPIQEPVRTDAAARGVLGGSLAVTLANGLGLVSALALDVVTAATFGLSASMDAFYVAAAVPQVMASVLSSVSSRVLVPVFAEVLAEQGEPALDRAVGALITLGTGALAALALLATLFLALLARVLALPPLTVRVMHILFLSLIPLAFIESLRAAHLTHRRFFSASLTNFVRFGTVALCLWLLGPVRGVEALAWGYVAGALAQALLLGGVYAGHGGRFVPVWRWRHPALTTLPGRFAPVLLGELAGQSNVIIERFFASLLPVGTVSALSLSRRLMSALQSLLTTSVGVVLLPRLSLDALRRDMARLRRALVQGLRLSALPTALVVAAVLALNRPAVALLFERGAFDGAATALTGRLVAVFVPSILLMSLSYLLVTTLYALGEPKTVMWLRFAFLGFSLLFNAALVPLRSGVGLAAAYTLSHLAYLLLIAGVLRRRLPGLWRGQARHAGGLLLAAAVAGGAMAGVRLAVARALPVPGHLPAFVSYLLQLAPAFGAGAALYLGLALALGLLDPAALRIGARRRGGGAMC